MNIQAITVFIALHLLDMYGYEILNFGKRVSFIPENATRIKRAGLENDQPGVHLSDYVNILGRTYHARTLISDYSKNVDKILLKNGKIYFKSSLEYYRLAWNSDIKITNETFDDDPSFGYQLPKKASKEGCFYVRNLVCVKTRSSHVRFKFTHLRKIIGFLIGFDANSSFGTLYVFNIRGNTSEIVVNSKAVAKLGSSIVDVAVDKLTGSIVVVRKTLGSVDQSFQFLLLLTVDVESKRNSKLLLDACEYGCFADNLKLIEDDSSCLADKKVLKDSNERLEKCNVDMFGNSAKRKARPDVEYEGLVTPIFGIL